MLIYVLLLLALTDDTWEEVVNFLDLEEDRLTFKGFLQLYQLQTGGFLLNYSLLELLCTICTV